MTEKLIVNCPICEKETIYDISNKNRPFCSDKCKQIDLGTWATNQYAIPSKLTEDDIDAELEMLIKLETDFNP